MAIRDLLLFAVLGALILIVPRRPFIGALAWVVFGVMSPHRLAWGYAYDFQFSLVIAIVTLVGVLVTREHKTLKGGAALGVLVVFLVWICICNVFALRFEPAMEYLNQVWKVFLMTAVLMLLMHTREQVVMLVTALVVSLGFYGVKGGLFVLRTQGQFMVNGPDGSVMEGNNSLGVGLIIVIPLMYFLAQQYKQRWVRWALYGSMALCSISVLGSYSRGALLAILAMGSLLWLRSRHKVVFLLGALAFVLVAIPAMPERWSDRMNTMWTYEQDGSAMGRIIAWQTAYNIAKDRFPMGGGFEWESPATSALYSPNPETVLVAHSIYFQVLGGQGFIGLALFLVFWWLVWRQCTWLRRHSRDRPGLEWAFSLGSMVQVSLVGYAVGGAFLNLAFWDLPYYLYAAVAAAQYTVRAQLQTVHKAASAPPAESDSREVSAVPRPIA